MKILKHDDIEIQVDIDQASAPIRWRSAERRGDPDEPGWQPTPFQTADAGHLEADAIKIVSEWLDANS